MPDRILTSHAGSLPRPEDLIALNEQRAAGDFSHESEYLGQLRAAVADVVARQRETGIDLLGEAIRTAEITNAGFFTAELYRLRGDLLVQLGRLYEAEIDLQRGLTIARLQQARLWELRAATSIARMWLDQGRRVEGRDLLAPVYQSFTEGFDTADLTAARLLLDELIAEARA